MSRPIISVAVLLVAISACGGGTNSSSNSVTNGSVSAASVPSNSGQRIGVVRSAADTNVITGAADINDTGTGVAAWVEESIGVSFSGLLWINVYRGNTWGTPAQVWSRGSMTPAVVVIPSGNAVLAWAQDSFDVNGNISGSVINVQLYDYGTNSWGLVTLLSSGSYGLYANSPSIAADASGNALAVWIEGDQVWGRYYTAGTGWDASATQLSSSPRLVSDPHVVSNGNGSFVAVWAEDSLAFDSTQTSGGPRETTVYAQAHNSSGWVGTKQLIGWQPTQVAALADGLERIKVDANKNGAVFVVWEQVRTLSNATVQFSIDSARYINGSWGTTGPRTIAAHTTYLSFPQVAVDNSGNAWALWQKTDSSGSGMSSVRAARFTAGAWGADILLDPTGTSVVSDAVLVMDGSGNAQAVWFETDQGLMQRRYTIANGWGAATQIGPVAQGMALAASDGGQRLLIGHNTNYGTVPFSETVWGWINP